MDIYSLKEKVDQYVEELERRKVSSKDVPVLIAVNDELFDIESNMIEFTETEEGEIIVTIDSSVVFDQYDVGANEYKDEDEEYEENSMYLGEEN